MRRVALIENKLPARAGYRNSLNTEDSTAVIFKLQQAIPQQRNPLKTEVSFSRM